MRLVSLHPISLRFSQINLTTWWAFLLRCYMFLNVARFLSAVSPPPQNPNIQTSSGKIAFFFEPPKGDDVNYYTVQIVEKNEIDGTENVLAQKMIAEAPFQGIIDDEMILPGNEYVAVFSTFNGDLEESNVKIPFIMSAPDSPKKMRSDSGGNWIELSWDISKQVDYYEVIVKNLVTDQIVFDNKRYEMTTKRINGLKLNNRYEFKVFSVVKNIRSLPLIEIFETKKFNAVNGGLAVSPIGSGVNFGMANGMDQTSAPVYDDFDQFGNLGGFSGVRDLEIYESGSGQFCINTNDLNYKVADIYFLVKDLSEMQKFDWEKTKTWLIEIVDELPISQKHIRIALAAYSNDLRLEFKFDEYDNQQEVIQHIFSLPTKFMGPRRGKFNRAIMKSIQFVFSPDQLRPNAQTYFYIVTNSASDDIFIDDDSIRKSTNFDPIITTFYIGKDYTQPDYMKNIASSPDRAFILRSYDRLLFDTKAIIQNDLACSPGMDEFSTTAMSYGMETGSMMTSTFAYYGTGFSQFYTTAFPFTTEALTSLEKPRNFRVNVAQSNLDGPDDQRRFVLQWDPVPGAEYYTLWYQQIYNERSGEPPRNFTTSSSTYTLTREDITYGFFYYFMVAAHDRFGYRTRYANLENAPQEGWYFPPPSINSIDLETTAASANLDIYLNSGAYQSLNMRLVNVELGYDETFKYSYNQDILQQLTITANDGLIPTERYRAEIWTEQVYPYREGSIMSKMYNLDIKLNELAMPDSKMRFRDHNSVQIEYLEIEGATAYIIEGFDLLDDTITLQKKSLDQNVVEFFNLTPGGQYKFQVRGIYGKKESPTKEFTIQTTPAPIEGLFTTVSATEIKVTFDPPAGKSLEYQIKLIDPISEKTLDQVTIKSYRTVLEATFSVEPGTEYIIQATSHMPSLTSVPTRKRVITESLANLRDVLISSTLSSFKLEWYQSDDNFQADFETARYQVQIYKPNDLTLLKPEVEQILSTRFTFLRTVPRLRSFSDVSSISTLVFDQIIDSGAGTNIEVNNLTPDTFYIIAISKEITLKTAAFPNGMQKFTRIFTGIEMTEISQPMNLRLIKLKDGVSFRSDYFIDFELIQANDQMLAGLNVTINLINSQTGTLLKEKIVENTPNYGILLKNIDDTQTNYITARVATNRMNRSSQSSRVHLNTFKRNTFYAENEEDIPSAIAKDTRESDSLKSIELLTSTSSSLEISWISLDEPLDYEIILSSFKKDMMKSFNKRKKRQIQNLEPVFGENELDQSIIKATSNPFIITDLDPASTYKVKVLGKDKTSGLVSFESDEKWHSTQPILITDAEVVSQSFDQLQIKWTNDFMPSQVSKILLEIREISTKRTENNNEYYATTPVNFLADRKIQNRQAYQKSVRLENFETESVLGNLPPGRVFEIMLTPFNIANEQVSSTKIISMTAIPKLDVAQIRLTPELDSNLQNRLRGNDNDLLVNWQTPLYNNQESAVSYYILNLFDSRMRLVRRYQAAPDSDVRFKNMGFRERYSLEISTVVSYEDPVTLESVGEQGKY